MNFFYVKYLKEIYVLNTSSFLEDILTLSSSVAIYNICNLNILIVEAEAFHPEHKLILYAHNSDMIFLSNILIDIKTDFAEDFA